MMGVGPAAAAITENGHHAVIVSIVPAMQRKLPTGIRTFREIREIREDDCY